MSRNYSIAKFRKDLKHAQLEEEVIACFQRLIPGRWHRPFRSDGIEADTMFEFKFDKDMASSQVFPVIAQGCHYLHKIFFQRIDKGREYLETPKNLAICDVNEALVIKTKDLYDFYTYPHFDWERPPSNPCPDLIEDLQLELKSKKRIYQIQKNDDEVRLFLKRLGLRPPKKKQKTIQKKKSESIQRNSLIAAGVTAGIVTAAAYLLSE